MKKKNTLLAMVLVTSMVLASCGSNEANDTNDKASTNVESTESLSKDNSMDSNSSDANSSNLDESKDQSLSPEDAEDLFVEKYPNAKIKSIEFEEISGVYKFEAYDNGEEFEASINKDTKELNEGKREKDNEDNDEKSLDSVSLKDATISVEDAINKSIEASNNSDAKLDSWSLSYDDDTQKLFYDIELNTGNDDNDFEIDATDGTVVND